jgi:GT2 family glycosyltransferase
LRVSAILIAYNQAPALRRAISALEASRERERIEILVVDCASRDESSQMDAEFPSINLLRLPHHIGAARAMNIATRTAKADLVLYLSPDVEVEPGTVAALADRLEPESEIVAVCPLLVDEAGQPASRVFRLPDKETIGAALHGRGLPPVVIDTAAESVPVEYSSLDALMVRKVFVRGMNYFDERFGHYWADANLSMQIRRAGKKILLYPGIRARLHPAGDPLEHVALARTDRITGAAAFVGKYEGGMAGLLFRLREAFRALVRLNVGQFVSILSGAKLDGSQAS